jgi:hypothetical protein
MSAYLHRLIARDHAPTVALAPFVRSRSPIAAIDQRLAVDENLGHGLAELGESAPGLDLAEPELPSPQPITVPTSAPESSTPTIQRKVAAPLSSEAAVSPSSPSAPTRARAPQLDPGPLFDLGLTPREFDETRIHEIVHESTTTSLAPEPRVLPGHVVEQPRIAPSSLAEPRFAPLPSAEPSVARHPTLEPRSAPSPAQAFAPAPAPWRPFEPFAPIVAPSFAPSFAPSVAPSIAPSRPGLHTLTPSAARLEPSPRVELPTTDSVQVQIPRSVQARAVPPTPERPRNTPPARSTPQRKTRIDIESISQIGPLDHHFPNRRRLRLRYR